MRSVHIPDSIHIGGAVHLPLAEVSIDYIRSPGPGGQNVNKVASAAQLRFDLMHSPSLPEPVKLRAAALAGSRLTTDGSVVITANRYRNQPQNRDDAIGRLVALLRAALVPPKPRKPTRPTLASKRRRLEAKTQRGTTKRLRGRIED
ncbi:alternative ribosome rescue aminoacyl-tRNA hydrolase ArfB [Devosia sp.]|uniref:alternative ribosome rescue aminoacyl-tRNA hydrolase ArfB n=1 Tax=Devosia sp. TaxID=1871048 RepID=UPI00343D934C